MYAAASGPSALRAAGAVADGAFINYGLQREHVERAAALVNEGAAAVGRDARGVDTWWVACLDCSSRRETAHDKLGNILGFVAAYVLGRDPERRGVPPELVPAVRELRATYTTRQREMDPGLIVRLGSSTTSTVGWPWRAPRRTAPSRRARRWPQAPSSSCLR